MLWRLERLDFESGIFGVPVGRVVPAGDGGSELAALSNAWVRNGMWLVCARIDEGDETADRVLRAAGFVPIETLVTLERPVSFASHRPKRVRAAVPADRAACLEIARTAFVHDRFHADERVPNPLADAYKETWVANSLAGRAAVVLVAEKNAACVGFVTCMVNDDAAVIDLIAVAPLGQGKGVGKHLVQGVLAYYAGKKSILRVGTQKTNTRSLALYESQGFERTRRVVSYHWVSGDVRP